MRKLMEVQMIEARGLLLAVAAAAMGLTVSCDGGDNPSSLVGQWGLASGARYKKPEAIELFKDGTGVVDEMTISWKVENKRLVMLSSLKGFSCDYKVSGDELTLVYDDGGSAIFMKGRTKVDAAAEDEAAAVEAAAAALAAEAARQAK